MSDVSLSDIEKFVLPTPTLLLRRGNDNSKLVLGAYKLVLSAEVRSANNDVPATPAMPLPTNSSTDLL